MDDLNRPDPTTSDEVSTMFEQDVAHDADAALEPDGVLESDAAVELEPGPTVAGTGASTPSRRRWMIAGGIAAAAVIGAVAAVAFLGARPMPEAFQYLPANSALVVELRPELPGDQRARLAALLGHFPGFADQSTFSEKLDEALGRLVHDASGGTVDYTTRIKPLLDGPAVAGFGADAMSGTSPQPSGLLVATTNGAVTCDTVFGVTTVTESHQDVEIRTVGSDGACAVDGRFLLLGDLASIRAGIDAYRDHTGLDTNKTFVSARERLEGDQLAVGYIDGASVRATIGGLASTIGLGAVVEQAIPDWVIGGFHVVDDALVLDLQVAPRAAPDLASGVPTEPAASSSRFATMLPADTLALVEVHGAGAFLGRAVAQVPSSPAPGATAGAVENALGTLSGLAPFLSWIEDVGIAVLPGDDVSGALLVRGSDAASVSAGYAQVRNLLTLASIGSDITLQETDHGGVTITTVDLGNIDALLSGLGLDQTLPTTGAQVSFSMAVRDDVLIVGVGNGVIERILDGTSSTLASTAAYRRMEELAGSKDNFGAFVAIDGILGLAESRFLKGDELESYQRDLKPYLEHLASAGGTTIVSTTGGRSRLVIIVK
ncbi:MAG: DUF3352 domain-containing protein [Chloroflexota bacterium]